MFQEGNADFCLFISLNTHWIGLWGIISELRPEQGEALNYLERNFFSYALIIFIFNQQLLLKHTVTASDLQWTPRKGERVKWRKALSCSVPGLLLGLLLKHSGDIQEALGFAKGQRF